MSDAIQYCKNCTANVMCHMERKCMRQAHGLSSATGSARIHLVLTYRWYDDTVSGDKRIEYREMTDRWRKLIFDKRDQLTHVRFARGYTDIMQTFEIVKIDVGSCPINGWNDQYYRIHFK